MFPKKKYTLFDCVRVVYKVIPFYALMRLVFDVVGGLLPALVLVAIADFIDAAIAAANTGAAVSTADTGTVLAALCGDFAAANGNTRSRSLVTTANACSIGSTCRCNLASTDYNAAVCTSASAADTGTKHATFCRNIATADGDITAA